MQGYMRRDNGNYSSGIRFHISLGMFSTSEVNGGSSWKDWEPRLRSSAKSSDLPTKVRDTVELSFRAAAHILSKRNWVGFKQA